VFIVDRDAWLQRGDSDRFVFEVLATIYGSQDRWDSRTIDGEPAVATVRRINNTVHTLRRSTGAARWKQMVADDQGGSYCVACGARENLHVDHIMPVSRGGSETDLRNLQLLCAGCNTAKRDLDGELLPSVLLTARSAEPTPRTRFKRLLMGATQEGRRRIGRCECGRSARDVRLEVQPRAPLAANMLSLQVSCEECSGMPR
jgi:hypothetical protein